MLYGFLLGDKHFKEQGNRLRLWNRKRRPLHHWLRILKGGRH